VSDIQALLERRQRVLGPASPYFYDQPLHIVRGEGAYLYDADGKRYLDAYNNVAHVGHCHPYVVDAIAAQAAVLNTNTRYLHETILDYGERLAATLPGELSVCYFVCTGSEANELAWRFARALSGGDGLIVTDCAYHGNTSVLDSAATEYRRGAAPDARVATIPSPDGYRGRFRDPDSDIGRRYGELVDPAVAGLRERGHAPAALLIDSMFTADGIYVPPFDYLKELYTRVRAAGGVCIADEVQAGFGRTGEHFWSFQFDQVIPDIVTMGKPMGNGHPLAAVVTTPEIADCFAETSSYFNTFGGNPVSCAAGLAVLDVLERESLQGHAAETGDYQRECLRELMERHELIGEVRGSGFLTGIELVRDRDTREPATDETNRIYHAMRDRGILLGVTGKHDNVLKIRPPMVFDRDNAEQLSDTLDEILKAL